VRNFRLSLCYDGSRYKGWQKQGNTDNTIQAKLENLLSRLLEQEIELNASGRTDAGVHAREQVCSFRADTDMDCAAVLFLIRQYLPEDIGALSLEDAPPRFHARLSCREKTYVYRIWNSAAPNVFERKYSAIFPEKLDEEQMRKAAELLCGEHDFTAFCSNKHMKKSAVRQLHSVTFEREGDMLCLRFRGSGFLYNMVRILSGTLIEVGRGERAADEMPQILASKDRQRAGFTAPACGLFLWSVEY